MIIGKITVNNISIVEVNSDPTISIDENLPIGSIVLWNNSGTGKMFVKSSSGSTSYGELPVGGSGVWGGITGTLSDQTDLKNKLDELFMYSNSL